MNRDEGVVPVTLVTGFLGAGKTTLLNHILNAGDARRFAIIENEFGDLGVDGSLMGAPKDAVFELNDGCVCCSVREDLIAVFEQLLARQGEFDHIIIETTGLAEPAPVMRIFETAEVRTAFRLDGVVTVVDAAHIEESLNDVNACAEQISYADMLILNKSDRVSQPELEAVESRLRQLNPLAALVRAQHAQVDLEAVLNLGGRSEKELLPHNHGHDHDHDHDHDDHQHDDDIRSVAVQVDGDVDVGALDLWLGKISRQRGMLRMKGIIAVPGSPRRFVFNGVRQVVDVRPEQDWGDANRYSRIVFIGRGLERESLQNGFHSCLARA